MQKKRKNERITFRMSPKELTAINKIQKSGDFEDISDTIRFCINFTKTILSILPEAIGESFIDTETEGTGNLLETEEPLEQSVEIPAS